MFAKTTLSDTYSADVPVLRNVQRQIGQHAEDADA